MNVRQFKLIGVALAIVSLVAGCVGSPGSSSPLQINPLSLPSAAVLEPYVAQATAQGGQMPLNWSLASGQLPPGVALSPNGSISGSPTTSGKFSFSLQVSDSQSPRLTAVSPALIINVAGRTPPLTITTTSLPGGEVQHSYNQAVGASGGVTPYKWSISSGSLPPGISLGSSSGSVSGTPTASGQFSFTVQVQDSASHSASQPLTIGVGSAASSSLQINTSSLPAGAVKVPYSDTLSASGGSAPYSWSTVGGTFPPGLSLGSSGAISGTPTEAGAFTFTAQVKDSASHNATSSFTAHIAPASSPVVSGISPNSGPTAGGTKVTISGSNFASGATVTFGGVAGSSVAVNSSTQIQVVSPAHIGGTVQVIVAENGQSSSGANFTYGAVAPTVSGISPSSGPTAGGTKVTISGGNFLSGAAVLFGSASASSVIVNSGSQLTAVTPPNASGPVDVTVEDPGNLSAKLSAAFMYNASNAGPLSVSSISPTSGPPGTPVVIQGTNFEPGVKVTFGSTNAGSVEFISATEIQASVPVVSTGTYGITVTNPDPSSTTLSNAFTVTTAQSLLAGMTPSNFSVPAGWKLAATQNFEDGGVPGSQSLSSTTHITCSKGHTGSCSAVGLIAWDGASTQWFYNEGQLSGREYYLSYYDWGGGGAANEEYVLNHAIKHNIPGPAGYEEVGLNLVSPHPFNDPCPNVVFGPQGNRTVVQSYLGALCYFADVWTQWEIWFRDNTPGASDGFVRVFKNGALFHDVENMNWSGTSDMTGMSVQAGGWYTKNVWTTNGLRPNEGGACTTFEGSGSESGSWIGTFGANPINAGNCAPAPPTFSRYIDDIILLEK